MAAHERRLAVYYAIMFGSIGFTGPFFAPWLASLGVDARLTGIIVALPSIAMVLTTVYLGSLADRLSDWRTAIIASDWAVVVLLSWLLFRQNVIDIIIVWTLTGLLIAARVPIVDAATLSMLRRQGGDYGRVRAIGSVGFVVALLVAGRLFDAIGFELFVALLVFGATVRAMASTRLPKFRAPSLADRRHSVMDEDVLDEPTPVTNLSAPAGNLAAAPANFTAPSLAGGLHHPGFLLVLAGAAIINASHAFFVGFGVLHWLETGISKGVASMLFASAVLAEIVLMWKFAAVSRRFSARYCMLIAAAAGLVRWSLSTMELSTFLLYFLQTLHALTYGLLFVATVNFIARRVDDSIAAKAQSLYATLTTGALAAAVILSGLIYERIGILGYWLMGGMCAVGALLIIASFRTGLEEESPLVG
jgi:PPP family 3-phenylpropionic acid transporter